MPSISSRIWKQVRIIFGLTGSLTVLYGIVFNLMTVALVGLAVLLVVYYFAQRNTRIQAAWQNYYLDTVVRNIERANNYAVQKIPVGIAVFDKEGKLQWHNALFTSWISATAEEGNNLSELLPAPDNNAEALSLKDTEKLISIGERTFSMLARRIQTSEEGRQDTGLVLYFLDVTDRESQRRKYEEEKACIAYLQFDNYADIMQGLNESSRANLRVEVTTAIGKWVDACGGVFQRYAEDMYIMMMSRKALDESIANKFAILDKVREIKAGTSANKRSATISISAASDEKNIMTLSQKAWAGLDLALGRGGDQAVVSLGGEVKFFGAKSSVQAKSTRVRARIVAQAIRELMANAENIFIMGHVNEDYDALGSSLGIAKMALSFHKGTYVIVSGQGTALSKLQELASDEDEHYKAVLVSEEEALPHVTADSLLILMDHHRSMLSASVKILEAIKKRAIIDHHRRAEDFIKEAELLYMEPSSSSTSELVTELLHYFDDGMEFSRLEASLLYAGILVDTKNFAVQTGERTFEAAAQLRRDGADPVLVQQLFKDDKKSITEKAKLISQVRIPYPGLAISVYHHAPLEANTSVIIAQAADELLNMDEVKVSVVMSENEEGLGISARSDGSVNVQIMMEELGGGGHQTVAGVKVKGVSAEAMEAKIISMAKQQLEVTSKKETIGERDKNESYTVE